MTGQVPPGSASQRRLSDGGYGARWATTRMFTPGEGRNGGVASGSHTSRSEIELSGAEEVGDEGLGLDGCHGESNAFAVAATEGHEDVRRGFGSVEPATWSEQGGVVPELIAALGDVAGVHHDAALRLPGQLALQRRRSLTVFSYPRSQMRRAERGHVVD